MPPLYTLIKKDPKTGKNTTLATLIRMANDRKPWEKDEKEKNK